ncbi:rcc01693 family protein [Brucella sp. BE17]|uniref:rcc01693 family protein n=1 Tax=Brucella sp. BE17 TaxID=3142977 RepID=UPI0031BB5F67
MNTAADPTPSHQPFPWAGLMRAGFGWLRLSSRDFWAMTPRELAAALGPVSPTYDAPSRHALDALIHAFPDR